MANNLGELWEILQYLASRSHRKMANTSTLSSTEFILYIDYSVDSVLLTKANLVEHSSVCARRFPDYELIMADNIIRQRPNTSLRCV